MVNSIALSGLNDWKYKIDGICWRIEKLSNGNEVTLDIDKISFIKPQGTIMLLLICKAIWDKTSVKVKIDNINPSVHAYLDRVNFFEFPFLFTDNKLSWWSKYTRNPSSTSVIEITRISSAIESANYKNKIKNILETWFPDRKNSKYCDEVSTMVSEICNNSLEHSLGTGDIGECYCQLQKFTTKHGAPEIVIAIGDVGVGIRQHLQNSHNWIQNSDILCIKKILDGLSGRADGSGGMGIPFIKDIVLKTNGTFIIRSGKAVVEISNSIRPIKFNSSFPGTQSLLILN